MNHKGAENGQELLTYQRERFQGLMEELVDCCQMRTAYLARQFATSQAEMRALLLFSGERYLTAKSIAAALDVSKSRVTKIIESLIKKGLVQRVPDPADARVKLISLTQEGETRMESIAQVNSELHLNVLTDLEPEERKQVLRSLELLRAGMEVAKTRML